MNGMKRVCGIDESGRGALAGPLVAAAVVLTGSRKKIEAVAKIKIKDSKLLNARQRKRLYQALKKSKAMVVIDILSARQINNHGIGWANREIIRRLIRRIEADEFIVDGKLKIGRIKGKTHSIRCVVDADATITPVMLAGIVAKVERDSFMTQLHKAYPKYR